MIVFSKEGAQKESYIKYHFTCVSLLMYNISRTCVQVCIIYSLINKLLKQQLSKKNYIKKGKMFPDIANNFSFSCSSSILNILAN